MNPELIRKAGIIGQLISPNGRIYSNLESNCDCNRSCWHCKVPQTYNKERESTVAENCQQIDWLYANGFRLLNFIGGEPFLPALTKERITFTQHTIEVIQYASRKGVVVNVTTNGDFVTPDLIQELKSAGLDSLTFSLHSFTEAGLKHIIRCARMASRVGIIPVVNTVLTSENCDILPNIAASLAQNGILLSACIVQEKGEGFSTIPKRSLIPTQEQKKKVFQSLLHLKAYGFIRNNWPYLKKAQFSEGNFWKCNPENDAFVHIGAGGKANVCSEMRTNLSIGEIDLENDRWREKKRALVKNCGGCLYGCYFESENQDIVKDIPTYFVMLLIKSGNAALAEKWGKFAVRRANSRF